MNHVICKNAFKFEFNKCKHYIIDTIHIKSKWIQNIIKSNNNNNKIPKNVYFPVKVQRYRYHNKFVECSICPFSLAWTIFFFGIQMQIKQNEKNNFFVTLYISIEKEIIKLAIEVNNVCEYGEKEYVEHSNANEFWFTDFASLFLYWFFFYYFVAFALSRLIKYIRKQNTYIKKQLIDKRILLIFFSFLLDEKKKILI